MFYSKPHPTTTEPTKEKINTDLQIDIAILEKIANSLSKKDIELMVVKNDEIQALNKEHRKIDKATDVLSFPMFEKDEIPNIEGNIPDVLGDIVISIDRVKEQAKEYGHSFERELSYMVVHGFYHLMGYDHMKEDEKNIMRQKEENVLEKLKILR